MSLPRLTAPLLAALLALSGVGTSSAAKFAASAGRLKAAPGAPVAVPPLSTTPNVNLNGSGLKNPTLKLSLSETAIPRLSPLNETVAAESPVEAEHLVPVSWKTAAKGVASSGVQETKGARQPVRFSGRTPARGTFESPGRFAGLRKRVLDFVGRHWELPVEELLDGSDVLLMGEGHTSQDSVRTITRNMKRFKTAGVTSIGIEGLKKPEQKKIDNYLDKKTNVPPDVFPSRKDEFRELLIEAKKLGIRVRALGRPLSEWAEMVRELAAEYTGDPAESFGSDLIEQVNRADLNYESGFNEAVTEVVVARRNRDMAEELAAMVADGGKAVALVGDAHVEHPAELEIYYFGLSVRDYGTLATELGRGLIRSFSLSLTGGMFSSYEGAADHQTLLDPIYRLIREVLPKGQGAYLPTSETTGVYHMGGRS